MIATKRVGVFGGTFDPIHNGHIHLINEVVRAGIFSTLVIVPAGNPWQKKPQASAQNRFEMTKLALAGLKTAETDLVTSDYEVLRSEPSYALDTITHLQAEMSDAKFTWIIGSDAIGSLKDWYQIENLATMVEFLIIVRPGFVVDVQLVPSFIHWSSLEIGALDISATKVREEIAQHHDVSHLIPESVAGFITTKGLYGAA